MPGPVLLFHIANQEIKLPSNIDIKEACRTDDRSRNQKAHSKTSFFSFVCAQEEEQVGMKKTLQNTDSLRILNISKCCKNFWASERNL